MTKIIPFKAIRPTRDKVQLVTSRPYYAYTQLMLDAKITGNPYSFIHIINPEFLDEDKTEPNTPERFQKVKNKFDEFEKEGIFIQEERPSLYIYKKTTLTHEFIGVIGGASIDEYDKGIIKKHEETLTEREETFSNYLKVIEFNAEPVLLFHDNREKLNQFFIRNTFDRPEYEFTTTDKAKHEMWVISDPKLIEEIQTIYEGVEDIYIADGHHRSASSSRFYHDSENKTNLKAHFLAYFIASERLHIMDYNRLVRDLNGLTTDDFLKKLDTSFIVTELADNAIYSRGLHHILLYVNTKWYNLQAKEETINRDNPVESLDTHILSEYLLKPILDISDLKTDKRIDFISGNKQLSGIKNAVDSGKFVVGFGLYPVSPKQLKDVADANLIMPPKSTWIEPKMRSGLTIYPLND